jgi:hypothetical protein
MPIDGSIGTRQLTPVLSSIQSGAATVMRLQSAAESDRASARGICSSVIATGIPEPDNLTRALRLSVKIIFQRGDTIAARALRAIHGRSLPSPLLARLATSY